MLCDQSPTKGQGFVSLMSTLVGSIPLVGGIKSVCATPRREEALEARAWFPRASPQVLVPSADFTPYTSIPIKLHPGA